jgi:beta-lactamase class A
MAEYTVSLDTNSINAFAVSAKTLGTKPFTVSVEKTIVADRLSDLNDVSVSDLSSKDQYVLVYDAGTQKYKLVNPDQVLNAAATEPQQPGLVGYADEFLNKMDIDLDDRIDVDAGTF